METGQSSYANAFHSAGGQYAVAYTNPNYYFVSSTYTAPGNYSESAFGHGATGVRTQRPQGGGTEYYLLPNSSASQSGFQGIAQGVASAGGFNYIYADGVSDGLSISLYGMSPTPTEITTDSQYVTGMKQIFTLSPLPVLVNGYKNGNPVTEEQEYVGASNVAGIFGESCFTTYTAATTDTPYQHPWSDMANALLATTAAGYPAICGGRGTLADNRAFRTYWMASWWLTYDPTYSVALELFSSTGTVYLFPEELIVPTNPMQSAGTSVASLQSSTGAYVREFAACYHNKSPWGACAAVVNPNYINTVAMPAIASNYHHALALDNSNLYYGGQATLTTSIPTSLAPGTAVILVQ